MTMTIKSLLFAAFISVSTIVWHAVAERHALRSHVESASGDGHSVRKMLDLTTPARRRSLSDVASCGKGGKGGKGGNGSGSRKLCEDSGDGDVDPTPTNESPGDGTSGPVGGTTGTGGGDSTSNDDPNVDGEDDGGNTQAGPLGLGGGLDSLGGDTLGGGGFDDLDGRSGPAPPPPSPNAGSSGCTPSNDSDEYC